MEQIHYTVQAYDVKAHLFRIEMQIAKPAVRQQVALPVWIPGSYLVREFAKNLFQLSAFQSDDDAKPVRVEQQDKCTWAVVCEPAKPLRLVYWVYAYDNSVRMAWLDQERGFFNPTSLCLRCIGQEQVAHSLKIVPPTRDAGAIDAKAWRVATAAPTLKINAAGFGVYHFADYDELADSPFELGLFVRSDFKVHGIEHSLVVAGASATFDLPRLTRETQKICETQMQFWHGDAKKIRQCVPFKRYVFLLNVVADSGGGLEHRNSTALICKRQDVPRLGEEKQTDGHAALLSLISHEYFHTWNVKRLHPKDFDAFNYAQENYTQMLWFFEGFTSYYDDLLLRRSGLIDDGQFLEVLRKTWNHVQHTPGRKVQSVAQASFDAWIKYYRPDANSVNTTISYYTKGALLALCFDLTLRAQGAASLDQVMRRLWQQTQMQSNNTGSNGIGIIEADFLQALETLGLRSFKQEALSWIHSTAELPVQECLAQHGVVAVQEHAPMAQLLGLKVTESAAEGVRVSSVLAGGVAEKSGFAPGDEWLGVEVAKRSWRIKSLADLTLYVGDVRQIEQAVWAIVDRDRRILKLPLDCQHLKANADSTRNWRLEVRNTELMRKWLLGE